MTFLSTRYTEATASNTYSKCTLCRPAKCNQLKLFVKLVECDLPRNREHFSRRPARKINFNQLLAIETVLHSVHLTQSRELKMEPYFIRFLLGWAKVKNSEWMKRWICNYMHTSVHWPEATAICVRKKRQLKRKSDKFKLYPIRIEATNSKLMCTIPKEIIYARIHVRKKWKIKMR